MALLTAFNDLNEDSGAFPLGRGSCESDSHRDGCSLVQNASTENSKFLIRSRLKEIAFSGLEAVAFSENSIHVSVHDLYRFQATQTFQ